MNKVNLEDMIKVAEKLNSVGLNFVFIGGGIIGFLIDDPLAFPVRVTKDIDVVLDVLTDPGQIVLEEKLRSTGFTHDMSENAPRCRWCLDNVKVDVLSIKDRFSGMNMNWLKETLEAPQKIEDDGNILNVASAPCFVAMKLEAFNDRGRSDYFGSRDMEDVISVVDGRASLIEEIKMSDRKVMEFISESISDLLKKPDFIISISGHLMSDPASQQRKTIVFDRLKTIADLSS